MNILPIPQRENMAGLNTEYLGARGPFRLYCHFSDYLCCICRLHNSVSEVACCSLLGSTSTLLDIELLVKYSSVGYQERNAIYPICYSQTEISIT